MESAKCIVDRFNVDYEAAKPQGASPPASGVQQADPAQERATRDEFTWSVSLETDHCKTSLQGGSIMLSV